MNFDSMLAIIRSRPTGLRELIEKYGATTSDDNAATLLAALTQARKEGWVSSAEVTAELFDLLRTLRIWEMADWMPEGMLNVLRRAIDEDGIPDDADRYALAELIERAFTQNEKGCSRIELIEDSAVEICVSLARLGQLLPIISLKRGARESVIRRLEELMRRLDAPQFGAIVQRQEELRRLFAPDSDSLDVEHRRDIAFVLDSLRGEALP